MRNLGLILLALLVLVYLAPVDYSPLTAETIGRLVMGLCRGWKCLCPRNGQRESVPSFHKRRQPTGNRRVWTSPAWFS